MILKIVLVFLFIFSVSGCQKKHQNNLDGEKLLKQKCSECHNLDLPPKTFEDEKAPPMMAVSFHIRDFIKVSSESDKIPKAIDFVKDYVVNPSRSKSFCDKKSLDSYGVMPSQKGKVTQDELEAIAIYMFEHFTIKNLTEAQALQNRLKKMPKGKRLSLKYKCFSCHKVKKDLIAPSFVKIAKRSSKTDIENSISNGSRGKWNEYHGAMMPSFKNKISLTDIEELARWIKEQK